MKIDSINIPHIQQAPREIEVEGGNLKLLDINRLPCSNRPKKHISSFRKGAGKSKSMSI
jgi:hypothetical protein